MRDFKKGGFREGGFNRGPQRGERNFSNGPRRDFSSGPKEMFEATCANCHKQCEVPFRPNGKKPVLCKDCFSVGKDSAPTRSFSRPESAPRPAYRPEMRERGTDDMKAQIELLNTKIDALTRLVQALEPKTTTKAGLSAVVAKAVGKKPRVRKVVKK